MNNVSSNKGFTLIELIVVIVILGIMAAVAGPKFVNLQTDARIAVMSGVEGSVRSAATLVYSKSLINGTEGLDPSSVTVQGVAVATSFGYPTAAGIVAAVDLTGATEIDTSTAGTFGYTGRNDNNLCQVVYAAPTAANNPPAISSATGEC
jgi:MSHA pilin protein MshA